MNFDVVASVLGKTIKKSAKRGLCLVKYLSKHPKHIHIHTLPSNLSPFPVPLSPLCCFWLTPPPGCEGCRLQPLTILSHKLAKSPMRFAKNAIEQSLLQIKLQLPANANGLANIGTWQGQGRKIGNRNRNRNCDCNIDCELKGEESNNHRCV